MKLPDGLLNFHTTTEQSSCIFNSSEVDLRMISFDCHGADGNDSGQRNCFVGRTPELKGKFDLQKAQALNVPKGPLFGKDFPFFFSFLFGSQVPTVLQQEQEIVVLLCLMLFRFHPSCSHSVGVTREAQEWPEYHIGRRYRDSSRPSPRRE